jgi:hypothetical protein
MAGRFLEIVLEASSKIPARYILFDVADRETEIYRERVYAYELYHQMRSLLDEEDAFAGSGHLLCGEIDKSGHPIIRKCIPDLVFHVPGKMADPANVAIVEIKSINGSPDGIKKDIETLTYFLSSAGYESAIHLVYGEEADKIDAFRGAHAAVHGKKPLLVWHRRVAEKAEIIP